MDVCDDQVITHNCNLTNSDCSNTVPGFICSCHNGYICDDGSTGACSTAVCIDVDECTGSVCVANSTCSNSEGSYECNCNNGYSGAYNGTTLIECIDVDECLVSSSNDCDAINGQCSNTDGSYTCSCPNSPYIWDANGDGSSCEIDIDECSQNNRAYLAICDIEERADCINTIGGHECQCKSGYPNDIYGDGSTCEP